MSRCSANDPRSLLEFAQNWLSSVRHTLGLRNDIYVALHGGNLGSVRQSIIDLGIAPERVLAGNASVDGAMANFGGSSFYALNTAKITFALQLLEQRENRPLIFSDIDTVWLRDPMTHLARTLDPRAAFAIGPDANDKVTRSGAVSQASEQGVAPRHHVCACFFAVCPSAAWLLRDWRHAASPAARGLAINEQKAFQHMLDRRPELVLRSSNKNNTRTRGTRAAPLGPESLRAIVAVLDPAHFPTGQKDPPIAPWHVWMHANWIQRRTRTSTTTAKRLRLERRGVWNRSCSVQRPEST